MWMDLSEWAKKCKGNCVPYECTQRVASAGKNFNNQVDRMSRSVDISQPPFQATPVIARWTHEQSSHCGRDGGYAWTQHHELLLTKARLAVGITECPVCQPQRPTLPPLHGTIPLGEQVDYTGPLLSWKGCVLFSRN